MTLEITSLADLRATVASWRAKGERVALVPTMGALHVGHLSLVEAARAQADRVVVSIFVNPKQFGPNEDFDRYPRPRDKDWALLREVGADAAWLPTVEEMYPAGYATNIHIGGVTEGLDGAARPGHFDGVATVVAKLLLQVMPDVALFGEKDYQQLCLIKRLVKDLNININIIGVQTKRDVDRLAFSSRNQYLSEGERAIAPQLYAALADAAGRIRASAGAPIATLLEDGIAQLLEVGFAKVDYLELRAEDTLAPLTHYQAPSRLLVAAWLGKTRLIDNIAL